MGTFGALIFMVTGQQLSVLSAARILGRVHDLFGGRLPSPAALLLDHLPSQQEVLQIAEPWRPYRSLATAYLFQVALEDPGALSPVPGGELPGLSDGVARDARARFIGYQQQSKYCGTSPSAALWVGMYRTVIRRRGVPSRAVSWASASDPRPGRARLQAA
jgi:hypothetical protein